MTDIRVQNLLVSYQDLEENDRVLDHPLLKKKFTGQLNVGDYIFLPHHDTKTILSSLPDTYIGINCFQVTEIHRHWDTIRDFGSDDVIPVVKPILNAIVDD